jgi:hypothetical protein
MIKVKWDHGMIRSLPYCSAVESIKNLESIGMSQRQTILVTSKHTGVRDSSHIRHFVLKKRKKGLIDLLKGTVHSFGSLVSNWPGQIYK